LNQIFHIFLLTNYIPTYYMDFLKILPQRYKNCKTEIAKKEEKLHVDMPILYF